MNEENKAPELLREIADAGGGTIQSVTELPDGSGCAVVSFPLPDDHWIYSKEVMPPPMPFCMGTDFRVSVMVQNLMAMDNGSFGLVKRTGMTKDQFADLIREVGRYAIRSSTMNGTEMDFDPDAMLQNMVVGMLGYHTETGLSSDPEDNPPHLRQEVKGE